jgi:hypothetical protein
LPIQAEEAETTLIRKPRWFCISALPTTKSCWGIGTPWQIGCLKIRNCMNIEGVKRTLALFEPPIDPGLLVKAAAAGVDIDSALGDLNAPLPFYRYSIVLQRAMDFCNDVKSLGGLLLSALEKRDAEALELIRSGHEVTLLKSMRAMKEKSIEEAKETVESLKASLESAEHRQAFYRDRERLSATERDQQTNLELVECLSASRPRI